MKKKLLLSILTLSVIFISVFIIANKISAADNYNAGGTVTGRIHKAPAGSNFAGNNIGLQKGDKVLMGTKSSPVYATSDTNVYQDEPVAWQLIKNMTYSDYGCITTGVENGVDAVEKICSNTPISAWYASTTKALDKTIALSTTAAYVPGDLFKQTYYAPYSVSQIAKTVEQFNDNIENNTKDKDLITYRNLTTAHMMYATGKQASAVQNQKAGADSTKHAVFSTLDSADRTTSVLQVGRDVFVPSYMEILSHPWNTGSYSLEHGIEKRDSLFYGSYWSSLMSNNNSSCSYTNFFISGSVSACSDKFATNGTKMYVRPSAYLSMDQVVFAVSKGNRSGLGTIKELDTIDSSSAYTSIVDYTSAYDEMKLRVENSALHIDFSSITMNTDANITQANENSTVHLHVKANNDIANSTVSALLFDKNGAFKYYMPLSSAKGEDEYYTYDLDLSGVTTGEYKISVVNEIYNENDTAPADSSLISTPLDLEVVKDLSTVTFKENLNDNDFFEDGRNAKKDDLIGIISSKDGAQPIQYELIAPTSGIDSSSKFRINKNISDEIIYNENSSVNVYANEKLEPGSYRFRIKGIDSNGLPVQGIESSDIEIVVFPGSSQIAFTPEKKDGKWYSVNDITTSSTTSLGVVSLDPVFALTGVTVSYSIKDIKIDDASVDDLQITNANSVLGKVTAKGSVKPGKHNFTAVVTYKYNGKSYSVEKKDQTLTISPSLYFVKTSGSSDKITEWKQTFTDVVSDQNFAVYASGSSNIQYRIKGANTSDGVVSLVNGNSGIFKMEKTGTTYIEAFVMDGTEEIACAQLKIVIENASLQDLAYTKDGVKVENDKITEVYKKDGTFQLGIDGVPTGSTITYKLKDTLTANNETLEDVIEVTENGLVTIKNASYPHQRNKVIVEATIQKSGYADETLDVIINIDKAEQTNFNFPTNNYEEVVEAGSGSFNIRFQNGGSSGKIEMMSEDSRITIDGTKVIYEDLVDETIIITAYQKGDRNYNDSEEKSMKLTALKEGETKFTVDISPSKLIYGGTAQFQPDEESGVTYTYEADPSTINIADIDTNNADKIITKKVGNAKFIITRYVNGVENGKSYKTIKVYPKTISVKVKDYEKKVGEALPTYELEPITGLVGSDDLGTPVFSCDATAISPAKDSYVISAQFPDSEVLKNYELTSGGIKPGKLLVTQDEGKKAWYEILGIKGDEGWYTSDVTIKMKTGFDYDTFSQDQSSWNTEIGLTSEGIHNVELWFKNTITEALSSSVKEEIKIDKTAPIVNQIKAVNSNSSIEDILNDISFGNFFKPGTKINIYTSDTGKTDVEVSKTKEVSYKIYTLDKDGDEGTPKTGIAQSMNEKASVTMNDVGRYKVCAVPKDHAGNPGEEQCAKVSIKDPEKDYDPNDLGCPSINLTTGTNKPILNIDRDGDGIPDMDIDTDGDGKADINIDNDKDGKPDTNLVILKEWDPKLCSTTEHSYGYVEDIKPLINIALDKEYKKPSINIDTTGDMTADINIDTNGDMKADLNIVTIDTWKPEKDYIYKEFQYDTMINLKRKVNIDTDEDGLPDVNIDYDGDGLPDLNIDIDGNEIPDVNIDTTGNGVPDINIDTDNDGKIDKNKGTITEWKPDLNTGEKDGFKYDTMSNIKVEDSIHELEHDPSGTIVETIDNNTSFNKKQTIVVADITNEMKLSGMPKVEKYIKENQELKNVLDVKLYEDNVVIQPDGRVRVKIPLSDELKKIKNRSFLIEQKDGTFKEVSVIEENGYLVYETDYLGKVSIIGDKEDIGGSKSNAGASSTDDISKSVKGVSQVHALGGAMTGDTTNITIYILGVVVGLLLLLLLFRRKKKES